MAFVRAAAGAPLARQRVVLADGDAELHRAVERALAPWHLAVVIEGPPPTDLAAAQQRADRDTARFVVWRAGDELVVYDRELATLERRASRAGPLDPPTAAAAALTIKTMMRLPPPPDPAAPPSDGTLAVDAPPPDEPWLRLDAAAVLRIAHGDQTEVSPRVIAALAIRPARGSAWRLGVAGDLGPAVAVSQAGFTGTWSDWAIHAVIGRTLAFAAWELEPALAIGVRHSTLDGTDKNTARTETATLADGAAGVWARWRYGGWTFGGRVDVGVSLSAPTYLKTGAAAEIFQVPGMAIGLGAIVARDL
jgi:hypothetical protein